MSIIAVEFMTVLEDKVKTVEFSDHWHTSIVTFPPVTVFPHWNSNVVSCKVLKNVNKFIMNLMYVGVYYEPNFCSIINCIAVLIIDFITWALICIVQ